MGATTLWKSNSEAHKVAPWLETLHETQVSAGFNQGTILNASDLNNAGANMLDPFQHANIAKTTI